MYHTSQKDLLNELMGFNRNKARKRGTGPQDESESENEEAMWEGDEICKLYICGWCPIRELERTPQQLGDCKKQHNHVAKMLFEKEPWKRQREYQREYIVFLERLGDELKDRLKQLDTRGREIAQRGESFRISKRQAEVQQQLAEYLQQLKALGDDEDVKKMSLEYAIKGCKTKLQKFQEKASMEQLENEYKRLVWKCETCGSMLENKQFLIDKHKFGKMHRFWLTFPEKLAEARAVWRKNIDDPNLRGSASGSDNDDMAHSPSPSPPPGVQKRPKFTEEPQAQENDSPASELDDDIPTEASAAEMSMGSRSGSSRSRSYSDSRSGSSASGSFSRSRSYERERQAEKMRNG